MNTMERTRSGYINLFRERSWIEENWWPPIEDDADIDEGVRILLESENYAGVEEAENEKVD